MGDDFFAALLAQPAKGAPLGAPPPNKWITTKTEVSGFEHEKQRRTSEVAAWGDTHVNDTMERLGIADTPVFDVLMPGWVELMHPEHERPYWFKESTGETTWEKPLAPAPAPAPAEPSGPTLTREDLVAFYQEHEPERVSNIDSIMAKYGTAEINDILRQRFGVVPTPTGGVSAPEAPKDAANSELAPGWTEAVHPEHGRTYWYNLATDETTWEKPLSPPANAVLSREDLIQFYSEYEPLRVNNVDR
jgi:hypothetical protein